MNNIVWVKILLYLPTWKMPEIRPKEFYTDDVTLPRSIQHLWLADTDTVKIQNLAATNEGPLYTYVTTI